MFGLSQMWNMFKHYPFILWCQSSQKSESSVKHGLSFNIIHFSSNIINQKQWQLPQHGGLGWGWEEHFIFFLRTSEPSEYFYLISMFNYAFPSNVISLLKCFAVSMVISWLFLSILSYYSIFILCQINATWEFVC